MAGSLGLGLGFEEHNVSSDGGGAAIDGSCFWILTGSGASAELKPYATGAVTDYNLIWDLDGDNYMPQETPTSDGYWDAAYVSSEWEVSPKDV